MGAFLALFLPRKAEDKAADRQPHVSQDQQGKMNEASAKIAQERQERQQARKDVQKEARVKTLQHARELDALTTDEFNAAVRRLHSSSNTDDDSGNQSTLPEGLSWLTTMLEVLWPSIRAFTKKTIDKTLHPILAEIEADFSTKIELQKFDLGKQSPAFGPMTARKVAGIDGRPEGGFELSLGIAYKSDLRADLSTPVGRAGVKNVEFEGTLFVWLRPFVDENPLVGGVEMGFVNPPKLRLHWTGLANVVDIPGLAGIVRNKVDAALATACVVPNLIAKPLHPCVDAAKLSCPPPEGIVRLTVVSATNLPSMDFGGGCDPYVRIRVGAQEHRTKYLKNTRWPKWNETFDFLVYNQEQYLVIDVLDHDFSIIVDGDDLVGSVERLPVNRIVKRRIAEVPLLKNWLPVVGEEKEGGDYPPCLLQLKAEWIDIVDSEAAEDDRLVSVHISDIEDVPEDLQKEAPFSISATVDGKTETTKAGNAKPGSWTESAEILRIIRTQPDRSTDEIARFTGLGGTIGTQLIEQALEKYGERYALDPDEVDGSAVWWKQRDYIVNHSMFPNSAEALHNEKVQWASQREDERLPLADNAELTERKAFYKKSADMLAWHASVSGLLIAANAARSPYWEQVLYMRARATKEVRLQVLGKRKKVLGTTTLTVSDVATGDEADAKGPFPIELTHRHGKATVQLQGGVTVKSLKVAKELPANWDLKADSLDAPAEFAEWWKDDVFADDYKQNNLKGKKWTTVNWVEENRDRAEEKELVERQKYYDEQADLLTTEPSGTKESALHACLQSGALTWGDYDSILGRINNDGVPTSSEAETLEWINLLLVSLWDHIKVFAEKTVEDDIEPKCSEVAKEAAASLPLQLDVKIPRADLGSRPPTLGTIEVEKLVKTNGWGGEYDGMMVTLHDVTFASDVDVGVEVLVKTLLGTKTIKVGIKDVLLRATVKIRIGPMLPDLPLVGALSVTLPFTPDVCIEYSGVFNVVDKIPGMSSLVTNAIRDGIAGFCCVPNYIVQAFDPLLDHAVELSYPKPKGVLRLTVESARNLEAGDITVTGGKNSDAYAKIRVGGSTEKTSVVTSLDPVWTEGNVKDFVVHDFDQNVDVEVLDADGMLRGFDDSLGMIYTTEPTVGGGSLVRNGVPVRTLLHKGANAEFALARKVKDESLGEKGEIVFKTKPCVGVNEEPSVLVVTPTWLEFSGERTGRVSSYLVSVQVEEIKGMPSAMQADLNGPFTVRVTAQGNTAKTKAGWGKEQGNIDGSTLLKTVQEMHASGVSEDEIAESLEVDEPLVTQAIKFGDIDDEDEKVKSWINTAVASVGKNKALENPQFLHRLNLVIDADVEDSTTDTDAFVCPVLFEVLNKEAVVLGSTTVDYNINDNYNAEDKEQTPVHGPFAIEVNLTEKKSGIFAFVGRGKTVRDAFEGTWQLYGSVQVAGLRPAEKHRDPAE